MKRLLFATLSAVFMLAQPATYCSDWVEDPTRTQFQLPPRPQARGTQEVVPPDDIPSIGVIDTPGMHSSPPSPPSTATIQAGVSKQGLQEQPRVMFPPPPVHAGELQLLVPPETKVVSPKVYSGWLQETHPNLAAMTKEAVIEVKGQWDDSGHAMHAFGFNSTKINPNQLAKTNLDGTDVLVVDCAGDVPPPGLEAINKFVKNGGWLLTTDWALDGCLAKAIPGYVEWNNGYSSSEIIDARVNPNAQSDDLLRNTVRKAYWKLDKMCQTVKIIRPDVEVLAYSNRLSREDPDGRGILAFTFKYGQGRVLHLVGHFDHNTDRAFNNALPDPAPRIGISLRQAFAANFIAASLEARPRPLQVKKT